MPSATGYSCTGCSLVFGGGVSTPELCGQNTRVSELLSSTAQTFPWFWGLMAVVLAPEVALGRPRAALWAGWAVVTEAQVHPSGHPTPGDGVRGGDSGPLSGLVTGMKMAFPALGCGCERPRGTLGLGPRGSSPGAGARSALWLTALWPPNLVDKLRSHRALSC